MGFLVLGNTAQHRRISDTCLSRGWTCSLEHASGSPWVIHAPGPRQPEWVVTAGTRQLALLGAAHISDEAALERSLSSMTELRRIPELRHQVDGDFHLLASLDEGTVQSGSISRTRRLCSAVLYGVVCYSDSASLLADLGGFHLDDNLVPFWSLAAYPPHPVDDIPLWIGVDSVPPGSCGILGREGTRQLVYPFWTAPDPALADAEEAAGGVRSALLGAVGARVNSFSSVSTDLSGGLDSTTLAFLLGEHTDSFETFHSLSDDGLNEDARWAAIAADRLPGAYHRSFPYDASPTWYTIVDDRGYSRDSPDPMARTHAKSLFLHQQSSGSAPLARLNGTGGDELFSMDVLAMHDYLQTGTPEAKRAFEAFVYERHELPRGIRRSMKKDPDRTRSFEAWFADLGNRLMLPRRPWSLSWETVPRRGPWVTDAAVAHVRRQLSDGMVTRGEVHPISAIKAQHEIMKLVRVGGDVTRRMTALSSATGVFVESPFLDEKVIAAALRAVPALHIASKGYKPLLAAAMQGILPAEFMERRSKGGYNRELYYGLEAHRQELVSLFDANSRVVERGIVDRATIVQALSGLPAAAETFMELDAVIGLELWLRDIESPRYSSLRKELIV